jgi:hypothetical protein
MIPLFTDTDKTASLSFLHKHIIFDTDNNWSRGSSVSIEISLRSGWPWFNCWQRQWGDSILFATVSRPALGATQSPIQWILGALTPGIKRPGRETDHLAPSSARVKNTWSYTSTPIYSHGVLKAMLYSTLKRPRMGSRGGILCCRRWTLSYNAKQPHSGAR